MPMLARCCAWLCPCRAPCPGLLDCEAEDAVLRAYSRRDGESPRFVADLRRCRCVAVYDGDTITVLARLGRRGSPFRFNVRLRRIDAPEMSEGAPAVESRDALRALLLNKPVTLSDVGTEKYGRVLATVRCRGVDASEHMLRRGLAVRYDGGTKGVPVEDDRAFAVGDRVRVTRGTFEGKTGVVERVTPQKAAVRIGGDRASPRLLPKASLLKKR